MPVHTVDGDTGMEYLLSVLKDSDLFSSDELYKKHFEEKCIPLQGDLRKSNLGVSVECFTELSDVVDVVIHNGAHVNHVLPYTGECACTTFEVSKTIACY